MPKGKAPKAANWSPSPKSGMPPGYGAKPAPKARPKAKARPAAKPAPAARPAPNLSPGPRNGGGMPPGYGRGGSTGRGVAGAGRAAAAGAGAARALGPRIAAGLVAGARAAQVAGIPGKLAAGVMIGAAAGITYAGYKMAQKQNAGASKGPGVRNRGSSPASTRAVKAATSGAAPAAMVPKNKSFGATFKAAEYNRRKNGGPTTFTWNGKSYAAAQKGRAY